MVNYTVIYTGYVDVEFPELIYGRAIKLGDCNIASAKNETESEWFTTYQSCLHSSECHYIQRNIMTIWMLRMKSVFKTFTFSNFL